MSDEVKSAIRDSFWTMATASIWWLDGFRAGRLDALRWIFDALSR